ncbi:hypothetical protein KH5_23530 [Urechidicola sp. KH5]
MAKAFYQKAQMAYENENYKEAIDLITETKNNLNGNTNADIIYLEAKARYKSDKNITKAKSLFESFLNESDDDDGRIQEVADILVDIKTSDNFYNNGNIKSKEYVNENGQRIYDSYDASGNRLTSKIYNSKGETNVSQIISYTNLNDKEKIDNVKFYNTNNDVYKVMYYHDGAKYIELEDLATAKNGKYNIENPWAWENTPYYITIYNSNGDPVQGYTPAIVRSDYYRPNGLFIRSAYNSNDYVLYEPKNPLIYSYHDSPEINSATKEHKYWFGMVKELGYWDESLNTWIVMYFNSEGIPEKKEHYKNVYMKKLRSTWEYNVSQDQWVQQ